MHTKWTARRLAADAMFAAMVTVLGLVSISTGNLKITVEALPVFLGALLTGAFAERGIWVSCALLAVSFLIMFIREEEAK